MATHKVIVFSDGETWEELNDGTLILEVTDNGRESLMDGTYDPSNLPKEYVVRISGVKEA
jgi:hypothetical protein